MSRFQIQKPKQVSKGWKETLVDRINEGKALPIISNIVTNNLLFGSHDEIVEGWAFYNEYPFGDKKNLAYMAQFQNVKVQADGQDAEYVKRDYLGFLKTAVQAIAAPDLVEEFQEDANADKLTFSETADRLSLPNFTDGQKNPLLLLANLPLSIYLTTSYHDVLEKALQKAGKTPRSEISYWNNQLSRVPSIFKTDPNYHPSTQEPLVYHLHGLDSYPSSLVITEDDHLDFLVNISRDWEGVPLIVRQALADSSVMLLGYRLRDWDFRTIFRGLIKASLAERRPKSVAIQLNSSDQAEQTYLRNYLDQEGKFEVYWGDFPDFMQQIWQAWSG